MSKNVTDLLKEVIEERKTDPEKFSEKIEIDPLIDELVQIEKDINTN